MYVHMCHNVYVYKGQHVFSRSFPLPHSSGLQDWWQVPLTTE